MKKDYKKWTPLKQILNNKVDSRLFFHEREVWYCHLGENVGFEQDGRGEQYLRRQTPSTPGRLYIGGGRRPPKRKTQGFNALSLSCCSSTLRRSRAEAIC